MIDFFIFIVLLRESGPGIRPTSPPRGARGNNMVMLAKEALAFLFIYFTLFILFILLYLLFYFTLFIIYFIIFFSLFPIH